MQLAPRKTKKDYDAYQAERNAMGLGEISIPEGAVTWKYFTWYFYLHYLGAAICANNHMAFDYFLARDNEFIAVTKQANNQCVARRRSFAREMNGSRALLKLSFL